MTYLMMPNQSTLIIGNLQQLWRAKIQSTTCSYLKSSNSYCDNLYEVVAGFEGKIQYLKFSNPRGSGYPQVLQEIVSLLGCQSFHKYPPIGI